MCALLSDAFVPNRCQALTIAPFFRSDSPFGVELQAPNITDRQIELLQDAGITWVRLPLEWASTEDARRRLDFTRYSEICKRLEVAGLSTVLLILPSHPQHDAGRVPSSKSAVSAFNRWISAAVQACSKHARLGIQLPSHPFQGAKGTIKLKPDEYVRLSGLLFHQRRSTGGFEEILGPELDAESLDLIRAAGKSALFDNWGYIFHRAAAADHPEQRDDQWKVLWEEVEFSSGSNPHSLGMGALGGSSALEYDNGANALGPLVRCWIGDHQSALPLLLGKVAADGESDSPAILTGEEPTRIYQAARTFARQLGNYSLRGRLYSGNDQQFVMLYTHRRYHSARDEEIPAADIIRLVH
jgi:hypothetical protein